MTRTGTKLYDGAEHWWPRSGQHLVAVFAALDKQGDKAGLWAATTISALLRDDATRRECLASLRARLQQPSRGGPKTDRYTAAVVALDALDAMVAQ